MKLRRIGYFIRFSLLIQEPGVSLSTVLIWGIFHAICKSLC